MTNKGWYAIKNKETKPNLEENVSYKFILISQAVPHMSC